MCHLFQRIRENRAQRHGCDQQPHVFRHCATPTQAVPCNNVRRQVMQHAQPAFQPPVAAHQAPPSTPPTTAQRAPEPSPQSPQSPAPFIPGILRPSEATHTTREGLTLSRGPKGELHATIANKENSIGINYIRKNGAYSTDSSLTTIYENRPGVKSTLQSIKQDGTYDLKVEHHGGGRTTLAIDMDPSVLEMRVQVGDRMYRLRESDITQLDKKVAAAAEAAKPPQIKGPSVTPSVRASAVPALVNKAVASVKANEPVIREALARAFKAVDEAKARAEAAKPKPKALEVKAAEAKPVGIEGKVKETPRLEGPREKTSAPKAIAEAPKGSEAGKLNAAGEQGRLLDARKPAQEAKPREATDTKHTNPVEQPKAELAAKEKPAAPKTSSETKAAEAKAAEAKPGDAKPTQPTATDPAQTTKATKTADSKAEGTKQSGQSAADTKSSTGADTGPEPKPGSEKTGTEAGFDPVERARGQFRNMADTYRASLKDRLMTPKEVEARRTLAEKYGTKAGMTAEQIKAALDGNPTSATGRSSAPAQPAPKSASAKGSAAQSQAAGTTTSHAPSPASPAPATTTALTPAVTPPPTMTTPIDMNARLMEGLKRFNQNTKVSEWAKNNQFKAMTFAASMSEAVTGAMKANYGPNDPHSPVPRLLGLLNQDIQKSFEFTTERGGLTSSILAEGTRSAGDTAIAFGVFEAGNVGLNAAAGTKVGQAVGGRVLATGVTRTLGVVGIAYHGYSTFSDGSFVQQNDLQLAGSTASPVVMGAVVGAPLGPVGAAGGAVLGAGSEAVGVAVGYARLQGEIDTDWKKREVREALRLAEQGFILPSDDSRVANRKDFKDLPSEHQAVLTDVARLATLARLTKELHPSDLTALGFKTEPAKDASAEERSAVGTHNWERMIQLTEGRSGYNPYRLWAGDYIDELRRERPNLATRFSAFYKEATDHYINLYKHSPHVTYEVTASKATEHSELTTYIHQVANSLPADATRTKTLELLQQKFPGIEMVMQRENTRAMLINNLEQYSGNTGRYRKLLELQSLGE